MKLSEAKPCIVCSGPLLKPPMGMWYVVRVTRAMLSPRAANQVLGMAQMFGGRLGLAEVMAPSPDEAIMILGDKEPALLTELHICFECYHEKLGDLWSAVDRVGKTEEVEEVPMK